MDRIWGLLGPAKPGEDQKEKCWIHTSFRVLGLPEDSRRSGPSGQTTPKALQLAVGSRWVAWSGRKQKFKSSNYLIFKETLKQVVWLTHLVDQLDREVMSVNEIICFHTKQPSEAMSHPPWLPQLTGDLVLYGPLRDRGAPEVFQITSRKRKARWKSHFPIFSLHLKHDCTWCVS